LFDGFFEQESILRFEQFESFLIFISFLNFLNSKRLLSLAPHVISEVRYCLALYLGLRLIDTSKEVIREEYIDLIDKEYLWAGLGFSLNRDFIVRVHEDQIKNNVS